jgi:hypothetical protein
MKGWKIAAAKGTQCLLRSSVIRLRSLPTSPLLGRLSGYFATEGRALSGQWVCALGQDPVLSEGANPSGWASNEPSRSYARALQASALGQSFLTYRLLSKR